VVARRREEDEIMKLSKGFTVIELLFVVSVFIIVGLTIGNGCLNNRAWTEQRASDGAQKYIEKNGLSVSRWSCAGDSDDDGYGTCNLVLDSREKVVLNCPTDYWDINVWGAGGCKEVLQNLNINGNLVGQ
jgi:type II secretory pathway pseudopilin PulG